MVVLGVMLGLAPACGDDGGGDASFETEGTGTSNGTPSTESGQGTGPGADSTSDDPPATGNDDNTPPRLPPPGACDFSESFDVPDGSPWPEPWVEIGGTAVADVQGGRGRLVPFTSSYSLARMFAPLNCVDVEATWSFELTDDSTQGMGFFVRQNGGYLQQTQPTGAGYSTFVEKFRNPEGIAVWREVNGVEEMIEPIVPMAVQSGVVYRARLRVTQQSEDTTLLQARFWRASDSEPGQWQVERTDQSANLQGVGGGLGLDAWSNLTDGMPSELFFDDIEVRAAD